MRPDVLEGIAGANALNKDQAIEDLRRQLAIRDRAAEVLISLEALSPHQWDLAKELASNALQPPPHLQQAKASHG